MQPTIELSPDWLAAEMPPGYQNRLAEIQRLLADLETMGRFGRLLTETGPALTDSVRELFSAIGYGADPATGAEGRGLVVTLPGHGRLLVHACADGAVVQKKSPEIAQVFQVLQEIAEPADRVVFVTNVAPDVRPRDRHAALTDEAALFLGRMGATHVAAETLFAIWKLWLQEPERAREQLLRLHAHEGGTFALPAYART